MYHVFLTLSSLVDTWVASALPTVNNAAMNVSVQISIWEPVFSSVGYAFRSRGADLHQYFSFCVLRNCRGCTYHTACPPVVHISPTRVISFLPPSPPPHPVCLQTCVRWHLTVVFICIHWSLVILDVFHVIVGHVYNLRWTSVYSGSLHTFESFAVAVVIVEFPLY